MIFPKELDMFITNNILPPFLQSCYILWLALDSLGILLTSKFIAGSYLPKKLKINELWVAHIEKNGLKKEIYYMAF